MGFNSGFKGLNVNDTIILVVCTFRLRLLGSCVNADGK